MLSIFALAIVALVACGIATSDERQRFLDRARFSLQLIIDAARRRQPDLESYGEALRVRTPTAIVTSVILLSGLTMFVLTHVGANAPGDSAVLRWGEIGRASCRER